MAIKKGWLPPASPFVLIQESLFPSEWGILVSCCMLNCTSRKQVDKVINVFLELWPTPEKFLEASDIEVEDTIRSLGFASRRTQNLKKLARAMTTTEWKHADELPGIGQYAAAAHALFCEGVINEDEPVDHALVKYYQFVSDR